VEGGVAFFLLLILVVVAVGFAIALYLTGGALLAKSDRDAGDADEPRPVHSHPTSPTQEKVRFVGTGGDEDERSST
jgi:hypothetical protein